MLASLKLGISVVYPNKVVKLNILLEQWFPTWGPEITGQLCLFWGCEGKFIFLQPSEVDWRASTSKSRDLFKMT